MISFCITKIKTRFGRFETKLSLICILLLYSTNLSTTEMITSIDEYLIQTESLPDDLNFMPTLGNGHLGYTVFCDAIYMNGIYNGAGGDSRRARIPNWLNLSVSIVDDSTNDVQGKKTFELNLHDGYFRWQQIVPTLGLKIEQHTYAHRFFNRALIYELRVQRTETKEPLTLKLTQSPGNASSAFNFTPLSDDSVNINQATESLNESTTAWMALKGVTRTVEHEIFQKQLRTIYIYLSEDLKNGKLITMPAGEKDFFYRFILTADENEDKARNEMQTVYNMNTDDVLQAHRVEWNKFWKTFSIEVQNNLEMSKIINAGIFYMVSSLPSINSSLSNNAFYGLSPTGLGRGEKADDYLGHNFWDTEIWMLPVVTQFSSKWTQELLQYRRRHLPAARYYAKSTGYTGARYPWESAFTGTEVTQPDYPEIAEYQIHITPDIVLAMKHLFSVTNDLNWVRENDWPIIQEIVEFLTSRVVWCSTTQKFHVKGVMGPDEDHMNITDSVYTNLTFKLALDFAIFAYKTLSNESSAPNHWQNITDNLYLPYDEKEDYHPEYAEYELGVKVKQADVILMGYPLQYEMKNSTRLNDLKNYESVTRESGPAMSWSMFSINFLDIQEMEKAELYFEKGYKNYVRKDFKVWSEVTIDYHGAANFLTGIGGFLQSIINGYGGVRFSHIDGKSIMKIRNTHALPKTNGFQIHGLNFAGARFDLSINNTGAFKLKCLSLSDKKLTLVQNDKASDIQVGFSTDFQIIPIIVQTV